jgi:hypothetical protein
MGAVCELPTDAAHSPSTKDRFSFATSASIPGGVLPCGLLLGSSLPENGSEW